MRKNAEGRRTVQRAAFIRYLVYGFRIDQAIGSDLYLNAAVFFIVPKGGYPGIFKRIQLLGSGMVS